MLHIKLFGPNNVCFSVLGILAMVFVAMAAGVVVAET